MAADNKSLLDQLKDDTLLADVDSLIDQLKTPDGAEPTVQQTPLNLTEENLSEFILQHSGHLIKDSTELVTRLKKTVGASGDPEEISALADLVSSAANAIETVNKIHTQNKKIQAAKDLKQQEIEGKKEIAKIKTGGDKPAGLIVANREEIFAMLLANKKQNIIDIDIDTDDVSDVEETMKIIDRDKLGPA